MALHIPRLERSIPIVDKEGKPTLEFQQWWDKAAKSIENSINGIQLALDAAAQAEAAAVVAQDAADAANQAVADVSVVIDTVNDQIVDLDARVTNLEP